MTTANLIATRYIPADSTAIEHRLGIVYCYTTRAGRPAAIAYRGKSPSPPGIFSLRAKPNARSDR